VMHLAAETHVDRSLREPDAFIATNIVGTFHLLQAVLSYWRGLDDQARAGFRFHHVSTDEVFGGAPDGEPSLLSELRYRPSSPYSGTWTMSIGGGNCMTRQRPDRSPRPPAPRGIGHHAPGHPCNELTCHLCRKPLDGRTAICLHQLDRERMAAPSSEARFSGSDSGRRANERAAPGRPCAIRRLGVAHVPEHLRL
jgi:hypothetical protein